MGSSQTGKAVGSGSFPSGGAPGSGWRAAARNTLMALQPRRRARCKGECPHRRRDCDERLTPRLYQSGETARIGRVSNAGGAAVRDTAEPFVSGIRQNLAGRTGALEDLAVELYARGLSTRDI